MNEVLMRVVADLILFLAYCDDDAVDPDVAVEQVEAAAAELQKLTESERASFATYMKRLAGSVKSGDKSRAHRYATMFKHLGLDTPKAKAPKKGGKRR